MLLCLLSCSRGREGRLTRTNTAVDVVVKDGGVAEVKQQQQQQQQLEMKMETEQGHCAACRRLFRQNETETLVGFACGHVYHLGHLLHGGDPSDRQEGSEIPQSGVGDGGVDEGTATFTRSVASKVTNARLLKDRIEGVGGCRVCRARREMESEGG